MKYLVTVKFTVTETYEVEAGSMKKAKSNPLEGVKMSEDMTWRSVGCEKVEAVTA